MRQLTFEAYAETHSHAIYYIDSNTRLLYIDYIGSFEECNNIIHARMAGAWAMVVLPVEEIRKLYKINS